MNTLEDQIKAATRAEASTLREVRPLRLPPAPAAAPARRPAPRGPRWRGWAAPLAAAAVVVALAVSLMLVKGLSNGRVVPPAAAQSTSAVVPTYYVALAAEPGRPAGPEGAQANRPDQLVVGDTFTGRRVATIEPPAGTSFYGVTAAADDRTFVVDAVPDPVGAPAPNVFSTRTFYLLRISPGASVPAQLTRLPIPVLSSDLSHLAMALSGSGRELAVVVQDQVKATATASLRIYSVASGKLLRSWSTADGVDFSGPFIPGSDGNNGLSWVDDDRTMAFTVVSTGRQAASLAVRVVRMNASGTDLFRDSSLVWRDQLSAPANDVPSGPLNCEAVGNTTLVASGQAVVCAASSYSERDDRVTLGWLSSPATTPSVGHTLYQVSIGASSWLAATRLQSDLLWAEPSGRTVVVFWTSLAGGSAAHLVGHVGVVSGGRFTSLPSLPGGAYVNVAW